MGRSGCCVLKMPDHVIQSEPRFRTEGTNLFRQGSPAGKVPGIRQVSALHCQGKSNVMLTKPRSQKDNRHIQQCQTVDVPR